ncbi:DUF3368 domain-containing protein [Nostoc sp.]|uniref:DUF3368 domain-containing protein n=1 Tax=Nostoc sp. TaxID=1180 RepID=UPI002FF5AFD8
MPHNSCSSNFSSDRPQILTSNSDRSFFSLPSRFDSHANSSKCDRPVIAKRRGLIPSISPGIQALRDAGLWLSDTLVNLLKTSSRGIAIAPL